MTTNTYRKINTTDPDNVRVANVDGTYDVGLLLLGPVGIRFETHEQLAEFDRDGDTYSITVAPLEPDPQPALGSY